MATHSVFFPRESCGQRSLVGCCPWGRTESDTPEATQHACMHWRRKWHPLQCSCLDSSMDGRAWWAATYGVAQSRARLKRLSSSSGYVIENTFLHSTFHFAYFFFFCCAEAEDFQFAGVALASFCLCFLCFWYHSRKKSLLRPRSGSTLPVFSPGNIIFWGFTYVFHSF